MQNQTKKDAKTSNKDNRKITNIELKEFNNHGAINTEKTTKINLTMSECDYEKIEALRRHMYAKSFEEVVRRSLVFCQRFEVGYQDRLYRELRDNQPSVTDEQTYKVITFRSPLWIKELLDREKIATGRPYSEIIKQALRVATHLVENQKAPDTHSSNNFEGWVML